MKVGLLYSRSKEHPELLPDFMDGLKAALAYHEDAGIELLAESIGFGGLEKEVYEKAEKLLMIDGAELLVAYIDVRVLNLIEPLIQSTGKLLIVVNAGANYPEDRVPTANIIFLSLRHSFLCWLTGNKAGENEPGGAVVACSFYDAGYLHITGITSSYMKKGGKIVYNYVNKSRYDDSFEINSLVDYFSKQSETKKILSVFDSAPARLFYDRINSLEKADELELFVSPMMLENDSLQNKPFRFSIDGYKPYDEKINTPANNNFRNFFKEQTNREASIFALQGWETGLVLRTVKDFNQSVVDGNTIKDLLLDKKMETPRGEMKLDPESNYFITSVYQVYIEKNEADQEVQEKQAGNDWAEFLLQPISGHSSGWTNTYLCY